MALGKLLGLGWPFNSFLFKPNDRFMDFFSIISDTKTLRYGLFDSAFNQYVTTPGYILIGSIFSIFNKWVSFGVYVVVMITFTFSYLYENIRHGLMQNSKRALYISIMIVVTSFPLVFLLDRGNFEGIQFIALALFCWLYINEHYSLSILILAFAFCMKPFAVVFLVLFMLKDKYKFIMLFLAEVILISWVAFLLIPGNLITNLLSMLAGFKYYDELWVLGSWGIAFNHTLYTPLWIINLILNAVNMTTLKSAYFIIVAALFILISLYLIKYEHAVWRKLFILYLCMIGLPFISADYTLIHLYVPAMLFFQSCNEDWEKWDQKYQTAITVSLALLMIPKQYFSGFVIPVGISVLINPMLIYILIYYLIKFSIHGNSHNRWRQQDL